MYPDTVFFDRATFDRVFVTDRGRRTVKQYSWCTEEMRGAWELEFKIRSRDDRQELGQVKQMSNGLATGIGQVATWAKWCAARSSKNVDFFSLVTDTFDVVLLRMVVIFAAGRAQEQLFISSHINVTTALPFARAMIRRYREHGYTQPDE